MLEAATITCPYCWEPLEILLDLSIDEQDYIEDCQVCCQPMRLIYTSLDGELINLDAQRSDG
jgi:hypothetical protein